MRGEGEWRRASIELQPLNPESQPIALRPDENLRVIPELVDVLEAPALK